MKKKLKGLVALLMAIAMVVPIAVPAKGAISDEVYDENEHNYMNVIVETEISIADIIAEGEFDAVEYDIDCDMGYVGKNPEKVIWSIPDFYELIGWTIWEVNEDGYVTEDSKSKTVSTDYVITAEDIKEYGSAESSYVYSVPYIEAILKPIEYSVDIYNEDETVKVGEAVYSIEDYSSQTLDIPEGYVGYILYSYDAYWDEYEDEYEDEAKEYMTFVADYEGLWAEMIFLDYYGKVPDRLVPTEKIPYYVTYNYYDYEKQEDMIIYLSPGEELTSNKEVMDEHLYDHVTYEGEPIDYDNLDWEFWTVNYCGGCTPIDGICTYEKGKALTVEEYTSVRKDLASGGGASIYYYNANFLGIGLQGVTPRKYSIPVYNLKGEYYTDTYTTMDDYRGWEHGTYFPEIYLWDDEQISEANTWYFEYDGVNYGEVTYFKEIWEIALADGNYDKDKAKLIEGCKIHEFDYENGKVVAEPTLDKKGSTEYSCKKCTMKRVDDDIECLHAINKVTLSKTSFAYTGEYIKPTTTVTAIVDGKEVILTNKVDYKVEYKNFKNPGIATVTVTGKGKYVGTLTTTFTITPNWIKNVKQVVDATYTKNFRITWDKVNGVTGYEIYVSDAKNGEFVMAGTVAASSNQFIAKNLQPGTKYYYKVRGYKTVSGQKIYGNFSNVTMAVTRPLTTKGVKYNAKTTKLTWYVTKGSVGYEVYCTTNSKYLGSKLGETNYANRSLDVSSLEEGKTYYIKVRAYVKTATGQKIYGTFSQQFKFTR